MHSEIKYPQFKNISKGLIIQEIRKILWENLEIFLLMLLSQDLISFLWLNNYFSSMIQGFKSKINGLKIHCHKYLLPAIAC